MANLFLGGQRDGEWHDTDPNVDYWQLRADRPVGPVVANETTFDAESSVLTYRRMPMAVGQQRVTDLFVLSGIPTEETFRMLCRGYRQGVPVNPGEAYEEGFRRGQITGLKTARAIVTIDERNSRMLAWERIKALLDKAIEALRK